MKLVFANNYFYLRGGSEKVFFDEIKMLVKYGHKVAPFTRYFEKNIASEYSKFFPPHFDYENVSQLSKKITSGVKLIYSYECRNKFNELLNIFKPDVIHTHNIYGRLTSSIIDAAGKKCIPVVMTLHDLKMICPSYLMLLNGKICEKCKGGNFYHCIVKKCHKGRLLPSLIYTIESYINTVFKKYDWVRFFICPSKFLLEKHVEAGIPEERLLYIPNSIKIEVFEPNYTKGNYILFVGRLSKEKGIIALLKATKEIKVPVWIIGEGPMRKEYEDYVNENNITNIVFKGYKSGEELRNIFKSAAFLVFPSECYENAPMTILEAFAYGKPVIGANIGGIPEMVIENETGLLFNPGDYRELREKINFLLSNPSLVTQMGKNAREKVEKEFNEEIHYQKLIEVYERILL